MKGGVTAILMALSYLLDNGITPEYDVYAALTADEESGLTGIQSVRQRGLLDAADEIIVGEPTDCRIGVAEKGALWIRLKARGEQTHGAMPDMGVNAIEMLAGCISLFKAKCADILKNVHPVLGRPSISTTMMHGGVKCNIVPRDCTAVIDIRTTSLDEHKTFLAALAEAAREAGGAYGGQVAYEIVNERPALETPASSRLIRALEKRIAAVGKNPEHIGVAYYTDLSGLMDSSGKSFAIVGPGHQSMMHKEDEYITISEIAAMAEVYVDYILSK